MKKNLCRCGRVIPKGITKCFICNTKSFKETYKKSRPETYIFEVILPKNHNYLENITEIKFIDNNGKKMIILRSINDFFIISNCIEKYCKEKNLIRPQIILDLNNGKIILNKFSIGEKK
jgi:hypothetical protein